MTHQTDTLGDDGTPDRYVTINQIVAWNIAWYRNAAGLTQKELGDRLGGWSNASVSEAERSWDGKRTREFDAQTLANIATALGVPLGALFLPPADNGVKEWYLYRPHERGDPRNMGDLMLLVAPDTGDDTPILDAYRSRYREAVKRYLSSPGMEIGELYRDTTETERRAGLAQEIREDIAHLMDTASRLSEIADTISPKDEP